ncbi:MAG: hypothetical protein OHK0015_34800 [Chloroflexi bacterium OHK40]
MLCGVEHGLGSFGPVEGLPEIVIGHQRFEQLIGPQLIVGQQNQRRDEEHKHKGEYKTALQARTGGGKHSGDPEAQHSAVLPQELVVG